MAEQFDIPDFLKIDAKMAQSIAKEQARLRVKHGYDAQAIRAGNQYQHNQTIYEREIVLASLALESLVAGKPEDAGAIEFQTRRLADNLYRTGKIEEALAVVSDPSQRAKLEKIHAAIHSDDREKCNCVDTIVKGTGVIIPRHNSVGKIMSPKHGKVVDIVVCSLCGHTNVGADVPRKPDLSGTFRGGVRPQLRDVVRTK